MLNVCDPCELKAADIYRQARTVASKTSRGSDGNWYRGPEELPWQWHIWFDGGREVCSAIFLRLENRWQPGPSLPLANLTTAHGIEEMVGEFISSANFATPPKALGIILHVADEFALTEVLQVGEGIADTAEDLALLRYNLVDDPKEVLADREVSTETTSWRLLPFWGAAPSQPRCAAVALSRSREEFLQSLLNTGEEMRLPVRVAVTAAAMEALAAMPLIRPGLKGGCLIAFQYLKFTAVYAISPEGELRSARSLSHRGQALIPASFGDILWNMALGAELAGPDLGDGHPKVYLVSADERTLDAARRELEAYSVSRQRLHWEVINLTNEPILADLPGHRLEFMIYNSHAIEQVRSGGGSPLMGTQTFAQLLKEFACQSFFDTGRLDRRYPTQRDLQLLKFSTWFVYFLTLALLGSAGFGTYSLFAAMNHPSWQLTPEQVATSQGKLAKLESERKQIEATHRLLLPRSRGWVTLEMLLQLFPEDSGVRLDNFNYHVASMQSVKKGSASAADYVGMERVWSFKGLVKPKAMELLSTLNSQRGLKAFFLRVAEATGDDSYQPDPNRQLTITLTQGRNSRFDPQSAAADVVRDPSLAYPFTFEASITQQFPTKDPLALPIQKPF